jgi:ABC-type Fe3+ transport system substrate-binding protein
VQGTRAITLTALAAMLVLLGVPFAARMRVETPPSAGRRLIVVTPHVQQIREEFAHGFSRWHEREFGEPVSVDYRTPGGTTEIRRQLEAEFRARVSEGRYTLRAEGGPIEIEMPPGTIGADLVFGGGSYDHAQFARGVRVGVPGPEGEPVFLDLPMTVPAGLSQDELDEIFGENRIGTQALYDPAQFWIGTALSGFGIVYNRDILARLGVPEPDSFKDLTDPRLRGWVALADPRQSGSITTTFDSILGNHGWDEGWAILRAMCGNARYFTNASTKPPADVSTGDAAAALAIDFYGRGQAQTVADAGDPDRMGYIDPPGEVYIDADPVSLLRGGPDPELARRFLRFILSEEGQALWQFPAGNSADSASNPSGPDGRPMGPERHELRRMPVRRSMYARHFAHFRDPVDPFAAASEVQNPGWRTGVQMMMGAFGIDSAHECTLAWDAIARSSEDPGFPAEVLAEMRRRFFLFPETPVPAEGGPPVATPFTEATYGVVRNQWRDPVRESQLRIAYTAFFRDRYREIAQMGGRREIVPMKAGNTGRAGPTPDAAGTRN